MTGGLLRAWLAAAIVAAPAPALARKWGIFDCARPDRPCEATTRPGCNCHGPAWPVDSSIATTVFITGIPTESGYRPGDSYDITVWVLGANHNRLPLLYRGSAVPVALAGFSLEVTGGELALASDDDTTVQLLGATMATHTGEEGVPQTFQDGNMRFQWDLRWIAPPTRDAGPVTFYLAGNVVNGSDTEDADAWAVHPTGFTVSPATP
jgi:hypothetical protein